MRSGTFPPRSYGGHFTELGFNAIAFSGVAHCWARDIRTVNADSGVFASGWFCTVTGLRCELDGATLAKGGTFGHHGVTLGGRDNLLTCFDISYKEDGTPPYREMTDFAGA